MNAATLFAFAALLGVALLSVPIDAVSPVGTASAQICTPYLADGDVEGYFDCERSRCQWDGKSLTMMCYD
jgi:hypothetical protein